MFLIVEDNKLLADNIKKILEMNNFAGTIKNSAEEAENYLKENNNISFIILDINLPGENGFSFLEKIRKNGINIPVLILTSKNTTDDVVEGLQLGADDYMSKPFDISEFILRIKAILKRTQKNNFQEKIIVNGFEIFPKKELVKKDGATIQLSSLEFKLLIFFIENKGKILNRQDIYEQVWGDFENHMFSRTVDVYIGYLRKKLGQNIIKTKKGSGYFMEE